jgi:viroplasmin and RNaseH domain-containing protein
LAVLSFLPHLAGRNILLHEDNHAVCYVMAGMTSRSPEIMDEVFRLWYMLESNNIHIKLRYIISGANTWANKLSCHLDSDD